MENETARIIPLQEENGGYQRILAGPPETGALKSGFVQLAPGEAVGEHSTGDREELIVVLEGSGELRVNGSGGLTVRKGQTAYCPSNTEHNVVNTGSEVLRYVFVVAEVRS